MMRTLTALLAVACISPVCVCDIINVPADYASIDAAIDAALPGDEVVVAPGEYDEHYINFNGKAVTLRSTDPDDPEIVDATIIRGFQQGPVLRCVSGEGAGTAIEGLVITNGHATEASGKRGGGLEARDASVTVRNCVFRANTAQIGGGVYAEGGSPSFVGCYFENNVSTDDSGGMEMRLAEDAVLSECRFIGNEGLNYGGARISGRVSVVDCEFIDNSAAGSGFQGFAGGAAFGGEVSVIGCLFEGNTARTGGGASISGGADLYRCVMRFNHAQMQGGGLWISGSDGVILDHCIVVGNRAETDKGGGIFSRGSVLLTNSAIVANSTGDRGGAIALVDSQLTMRNSVIWGNSAAATASMISMAGQFVSLDAEYNVAQSSLAGTGNILANPIFVRDPDVGSLDPGDLRLSPGSLAIDAGENAAVAADTFDLDADLDTGEPAPFDLAGVARFIDDPSTPDTGSGTAPIVDIGPYEYEPVLEPCNAADLAAPYGVLDFSDVLGYLVAFGAMEAGADLAEPFGQWDFSDVVAFLTAFGAGCP